jgi:hypothetical protein
MTDKLASGTRCNVALTDHASASLNLAQAGVGVAVPAYDARIGFGHNNMSHELQNTKALPPWARTAPVTICLDLWGEDTVDLTTDRGAVVDNEKTARLRSAIEPCLVDALMSITEQVACAVPPVKPRAAKSLSSFLWEAFEPWRKPMNNEQFAEWLISITFADPPDGREPVRVHDIRQGLYHLYNQTNDTHRPLPPMDLGVLVFEEGRFVPMWALHACFGVGSLRLDDAGGVVIGLTPCGQSGQVAFIGDLYEAAVLDNVDDWWVLNPEHDLARAVMAGLTTSGLEWKKHPWAPGLVRCTSIEAECIRQDATVYIRAPQNTWLEFVDRMVDLGILDLSLLETFDARETLTAEVEMILDI